MSAYKLYRLRGSVIDPDTPWGPEDKSNDFQNLGPGAGVRGSAAPYVSPALDEDACSWDSCAGSLGPNVSVETRPSDFTSPTDSPVEPAEVHNKPSIALNLPF